MMDMGGMVGNLEQQVASRMGTARFGPRLGGWSGVTLPGSGMNIRPFPKSLDRMKAEKPDKVRPLIGSRRLMRKGIYF